MIAGLELPTSAAASCSAARTSPSTAPPQRDIAFVFQLFALYPHMNVRQNIAFPLKLRRACRAPRSGAGSRRRRGSCASTPSSTGRSRGLSGGDRQRVALGRAIVRRPMAFLMDEPLGTLDTEFRDIMCGELRELHDRIDATTVYVTHDQLEAMAMADKIAVMNHGVVEQFGTPQEIYDRPATDVRRRFHRLAADELPRLPRRRCRQGDRRVRHRRRRDRRAASRARTAAEPELALGVRPEHVRLDDASPLRGTVFGAEYLGTTQIVTVDTAHGHVKARLSSEIGAFGSASPSGSRSARSARRSSIDRSGRAICARRCTRAARHG